MFDLTLCQLDQSIVDQPQTTNIQWSLLLFKFWFTTENVTIYFIIYLPILVQFTSCRSFASNAHYFLILNSSLCVGFALEPRFSSSNAYVQIYLYNVGSFLLTTSESSVHLSVHSYRSRFWGLFASSHTFSPPLSTKVSGK